MIKIEFLICSILFCNVLVLINFIYELVSSIIRCVENICRTYNFQEIFAYISRVDCFGPMCAAVDARLRNSFYSMPHIRRSSLITVYHVYQNIISIILCSNVFLLRVYFISFWVSCHNPNSHTTKLNREHDAVQSLHGTIVNSHVSGTW